MQKICVLLLKKGLLCKETHKTVIRFAPPLMISKQEIDWATKIIAEALKEILLRNSLIYTIQ